MGGNWESDPSHLHIQQLYCLTSRSESFATLPKASILPLNYCPIVAYIICFIRLSLIVLLYDIILSPT